VYNRVVASTQSFKYQYKYQYLSLKYQYQYPCLKYKYNYQYFSSKYQYKYLKMVLKYRSSTSTSTQYYNPGVQAANLSDCRIESKLFLPELHYTVALACSGFIASQ